MIHKIFRTTTHFTIDLGVKNIQSMIWSSDDTYLAIKADDQIIKINIESGKKIANVRLATYNLTANSTLTKYIAVNTAGQLVVLSLFSNIDS